MKRKTLLLKFGFTITFIIAGLHTFFVIIGGPELPTTPDFLKMQELMNSIQVDSGGGLMRTTQNFMDGFNIIVSIFLFSMPLLGWTILSAIEENDLAVTKLTMVTLFSEFAFFLTSLTLLAMGGTILSGIACLFFLISLLLNK